MRSSCGYAPAGCYGTHWRGACASATRDSVGRQLYGHVRRESVVVIVGLGQIRHIIAEVGTAIVFQLDSGQVQFGGITEA